MSEHLLPLLVACDVAHAFTVLLLKRSILTEKVARRGFHVSREYGVDPLEMLSVGEVMTADLMAVPASLAVDELLGLFLAAGETRHPVYPVVNESGDLLGVVTPGQPFGRVGG